MRRIIVFCAGGPARVPIALPPDAFVIAADGGVIEAERLGVPVDALVGDLDSATEVSIHAVAAAGGTVERHPVDKDASDLELALAVALARGGDEVLVVGGGDGRLDHLLGNELLLASPRFAGLLIDAVLGDARLHVIRGERNLSGAVGEIVSLFAVGGPARGVSTSGFRWALDDDELEPGSTRGLSNEFVEPSASVTVRDGVVLAVRPGAGGS